MTGGRAWAKHVLLLSTVLVAAVPATAGASQIDAATIVRRSDRIRNPYETYAVHVDLTSHGKRRGSRQASLAVWVRGLERSLVRYTAPTRDVGKVVLMVGDNMWLYMPTIRKPIRISPQQRLLGQVSYGDIARTNFSVDYIPQSLTREKLEERDAYRIELQARNPGVTYGRVVYWIWQTTLAPARAEFLTFSGRLMKTAFYETGNSASAVMGTLRIVDALRKDEFTTLHYRNLHPKKLPGWLFNKNALRTLE